MSDIKPIETKYSGYKFRSRLEARWAVFFDAAGIKYQYEPEGYLIGFDKKPYLPDFFLPDSKTWVEVKGVFTINEFNRLTKAVDYGQGLPYTYDSLGTRRGLLILGPIPKKIGSECIWHPILQHNSGGWVKNTYFMPSCVIRPTSNFGSIYFDGLSDYLDNDENYKAVKDLVGSEYTCADTLMSEQIKSAYKKAGKARFEYGIKG